MHFCNCKFIRALFRQVGWDKEAQDRCLQHCICLHRGAGPHILGFCNILALVSMKLTWFRARRPIVNFCESAARHSSFWHIHRSYAISAWSNASSVYLVACFSWLVWGCSAGLTKMTEGTHSGGTHISLLQLCILDPIGEFTWHYKCCCCRIYLPICSAAAGDVYSHKHILAGKFGVSQSTDPAIYRSTFRQHLQSWNMTNDFSMYSLSVVGLGCESGWWEYLSTFSTVAPTAHWQTSCMSR
jgi:hypothetical protein